MSTPPPLIAIPPFYSSRGINEPIELYDGPVEVTTVNGTWLGNGTIVQDWLPEPAINLKCNFKGPQLKKPQVEIGFPGTPRRFSVLVTSLGIGFQSPDVFATLRWKTKRYGLGLH